MNCRFVKLSILACIRFCMTFCESSTNREVRKVAIIGGGIGGTSCAYFLNQLFRGEVKIHLYEVNKVGGRLLSEEIDGSSFEVRGAVIHPRNRYMNDFVKISGLKHKPALSDGVIGLYDGNRFLFVESESQYLTFIKMWWRYGVDMFRLHFYVNALLNKFDRIYDLQRQHHSFIFVRDLLSAMDAIIPSYLTKSVEEAFEKEKNYNDKLVRELVYATIRVNYGQDNLIHQFVGSVSVAGATGGLWMVDGGNSQVAVQLLQMSGANLMNSKVNRVELLKDTLTYNVISENGTNHYHTVIIAAPLTNDARFPIDFVNFPQKLTVPGYYHRIICTLVVGVINNVFFGYNELKDVPDSIFTVNQSLFYNSISVLKSNGERSVYKVFSQTILTDKQLHLLFCKIYSSKIVHWLAYPHYSTKARNDSFVLHDNLYYLNAIEWAASAMEMSAIGGKNVALLIYNESKGQNQIIKDTKLDTVYHANNIEL